ncbi:MAG: YfiR family protein [Candidatus Marithrix sp.]
MFSDNQAKKAGVVYNLSKFIDWPDTAFSGNKFNICVVGDVIFLDALKTFEKRQIRGLSVSIHVLNADFTNIQFCQTIYIDSSAKELLPNFLTKIAEKPILTISDLPNFVLQGGMIGLIQIKKRVQFAINLDATKLVNLVISAQLLRLAKTVKYKDNQINNP